MKLLRQKKKSEDEATYILDFGENHNPRHTNTYTQEEYVIVHTVVQIYYCPQIFHVDGHNS